jgi:hypothetical protein
MLDPRLVILAAVIEISGALTYAADTFQGRTQPNRVTWLLWTVVPFIGLAAQISEGVGWPALLTLAIGLGPATVLLASFLNKKAYWRVTRFDIICGILSVLAVVLWLITKTGLVAIALSITADLLASLPTILKAYRHPHTESANAYLAGIIGPALTLLTITQWDFANYGFSLYVLIDCTIIYLLVKFPSWRPAK